MRTTSQMRAAWEPPCNRSAIVRRAFVSGVFLEYHRATQEAWSALAYVFLAHGYNLRPAECGAYNCRKITGGSGHSLHAYGIAADFNWNTNPYSTQLITDMPPPMRKDVARIRTKGGVQIFRSGADWDDDPDTPHGHYDAMHYEINCTPEELAAGIDWSTVARPAMHPERAATWPVCQRGDRHPAVAMLQRMLSIEADSIFGAGTEAVVVAFQASRKLKADGLVGVGTWTALLAKLPPNPAHSPVKLAA